MVKNNITIVVGVIAVVVIGYFFFKSSPQDAGQNSANTDNQSARALSTSGDTLDALVGKPMPDIELQDKDGKVYTTADLKGKNTVLFFSEGLMCYPACWNQIASFGEDKRFNSEQIQAMSVVADSASDWQRAMSQMPQLAKATTLFDANANVSRRLNLLTTASSMHKGMLPGHTYIVLDKDAVVRYVLDDPNMAIANDMLFTKIGEFK